MDTETSELLIFNPAVHADAQFCHLQQACSRDVRDIGISIELSEFILNVRVIIFHSAGPADQFGEVECLDGDSGGFQKLLTVTNRSERSRASPQSADAEVLKSFNDFAGGYKLLEVTGKGFAVSGIGMKSGEGIINSVLTEVIAAAHFAAETVAAMLDIQLSIIIVPRMDENGNVEISPAESISNGAFISKVGESNNDTVNLILVLNKEISAGTSFFKTFDGSEFGSGVDGENNGLNALFFQSG